MAKSAPTKRKHDAQMRAFLNPAPLTIEQALASEDPAGEIGLRLMHKAQESMSEPERMFWAVSYYLGDTLNGGLDQTLINSTGEFTALFVEFANRYGSVELRSILAELCSLFPGGVVPLDREERTELVLKLHGEDPLGALTRRIYSCERDINAGLIKLAQSNLSSFNLSVPAKGHDR